jgi:chromate transport protein ChrA
VSASEFKEYKKFKVAEPGFNIIILHSLLCSIILLISVYSFFKSTLKSPNIKSILIKLSITFICVGIILGLAYGLFDSVGGVGHLRIEFLSFTAFFAVCIATVCLLYLGGKYLFKNN